MNRKKQFILDQARILISKGRKITGGQLATLLNSNGFVTDYGTPYQGGRGTYTLIRATYHWLDYQNLSNDARTIALTFTKANGDYAYN